MFKVLYWDIWYWYYTELNKIVEHAVEERLYGRRPKLRELSCAVIFTILSKNIKYFVKNLKI